MNGRHQRAVIANVTPVDEHHQVISFIGGANGYRRRPCGGCPWRIDQTGAFPAEAFRVSATTAYDASDRAFGCHESDHGNPLTCAGFLLRNAENNIAVRFRVARHLIDLDQVSDGGHELHQSYRAMATANGVDPHDEALAACRDDDEQL